MIVLTASISLGESLDRRDRCWADYEPDHEVAHQVTLSGGADVLVFQVTDADGAVTRVPSQEHPGLPNHRFAIVTVTHVKNGLVPVTCETRS
jgi:hypothetical protein